LKGLGQICNLDERGRARGFQDIFSRIRKCAFSLIIVERVTL
jgi:hypothetical protein